MTHLTRADYASAMHLLAGLEPHCDEPAAFVCATTAALRAWVACEHITLRVEGALLVSVVLERHGAPFSARDRERLALLRPHLAFLYAQACRAAPKPAVATVASVPAGPTACVAALTLREREVMRWLTAGKTDGDIAGLLAISRRTVQKHLEHIYVKLGVETRTAAVMRALAGTVPRRHVAPSPRTRAALAP